MEITGFSCFVFSPIDGAKTINVPAQKSVLFEFYFYKFRNGNVSVKNNETFARYTKNISQ